MIHYQLYLNRLLLQLPMNFNSYCRSLSDDCWRCRRLDVLQKLSSVSLHIAPFRQWNKVACVTYDWTIPLRLLSEVCGYEKFASAAYSTTHVCRQSIRQLALKKTSVIHSRQIGLICSCITCFFPDIYHTVNSDDNSRCSNTQ